jgi:hypothetical protein
MPYAASGNNRKVRERHPNAVEGTGCDDVKCSMLIVSSIFVKLMFFFFSIKY